MRSHVVNWLGSFLPWNVAQLVAPSWFTCVGIAGVVTLIVMLAIARRNRIDSGAVASVVLWSYVAAVVGGIVIPSFIDLVEQKLSTGHVHLRWAGMTSFWGYLAGFAAVVIVCRDHKLSLGKLGDLATAPLGFALVFARLGCFLAGCDYGKVTSLPWAVRFPSGSPAWHAHVNAGLVPASRPESLPVHPTQVYEALLGVVIVAVAFWAARQKWVRAAEGRVALVGIAVYAVGRIVIEMFRGDVGRGIYAGMSSGQIFSICVLAALALVMLRKRAMPVIVAAAMLVLVVGTEEHAHAQAAPKQQKPGAQPAQPPAPQQKPAPQQQPAPQQPAPQQPAPQQPGQQPYPQQPYPQQPYPQQYPAPQGYPQQPYPQQPYPQQYPQQPYPQQPYPQQPYPYPQPTCPQPPCPAYPYPYQPPGTPPPFVAPPPRQPRNLHLVVGLLGGFAMPINRRPEQVAMLAGPSVSAGYMFGRAGIWLDFDSLGNRDASHGTFLLSGSMTSELNDRLTVGGRVGVGATLVNFDEPAFRDVSGTSFRIEAITDYEISDSWSLWARPLSFDILTAQELGGPITTWQIRAGLAYRFDGRAKALSAAQPAPAMTPAAPAPTAATTTTPTPAVTP